MSRIVLAVSLLAAPFTSSANAEILTWNSALDGSQEVPARATPATGIGVGTVDTVTGDLTWNIDFTADDLLGTVTAAHFHEAPFGVNGPIRVPIDAVSGTVPPLIGVAVLTSDQLPGFLAGNFYINIHSTTFPGGEIRGQVDVVAPEPGTLGMLTARRAVLLWQIRKRRSVRV